MWFPFLIHTAPFISISPAFTALPRRLSVSAGLRKMGLTQKRNTFTAPFSFDVIRNSIPSKWVFRISQQSLKTSRDLLLSRAAHALLHSGHVCSYIPGDKQTDQPLSAVVTAATLLLRVFSVSTRDCVKFCSQPKLLAKIQLWKYIMHFIFHALKDLF